MSKLKLSNTVRSQLPDFIKGNSDYENFILFLEAYYEFIDQWQKRNIEDLRNIDVSLDEFITQFKKEYNYNSVYSGNEALFLRNIKQLYASKGSESSYKLLFRLLFGKDNTELVYPGESLLIPSDGKWIQESFLFAEISSGDIRNIVGKEITFQGINKSPKVFIEKIKQYSGNIYKLFLGKTYQLKDIEVGSAFNSNSVTGIVKPTTTKYSVISAGKKFKVGQIFNISQGATTGTKIKITNVGENGEIIGLKILKHGVNYSGSTVSQFLPWITDTATNGDFELGDTSDWLKTASFSIVNDSTNAYRGSWCAKRDNTLSGATLRNQNYNYCKDDEKYIATTQIKRDSTANNGVNYIRIAGYNSIGTETILGIGSDVSTSILEKYTLSTVTVTIPTGTGIIRVRPEIVSTSTIGNCYYDNITMRNVTGIDPSDYGIDAEIEFTVGAVAQTPGYFSNNDGFLDDAIYLQDSKYYQAYSYVIKIDEQLDKYKDMVKKYIHPAGFAMFSEYTLNDEFSLTPSLISSIEPAIGSGEGYVQSGYVEEGYVE